ncbi:MAG TPA: prepilin peptidase [Solimonas sp.]|nr:prepilin peptidase [Solimonas sp.]
MAVSLVLGGWAGAIAWSDWASRRIPNAALVLLLVPAALALAINGQGLLGQGVWSSLGGMALAFGALLPGYVSGRLGAGDVKFAACLGLLLGLACTVEMLLAIAIAQGVLSAVMLWRGADRKTRLAAVPLMAGAFVLELAGGPWLRVLQDWQ